MKKFPTLYKKTSTGKIQTWEISVDSSVITSYSGQKGGVLTPTIDHITKGKNFGKKNETTPEEQALTEAEARWLKKKKKGYVENINDALDGNVDDIIQGGYNPTLAHNFAKHGDKIKYPCAVQPKLDGIRCCSVGSSLWSRARFKINSVPHILEDIEKIGITHSEMFDGELYNHQFRNDFEVIKRIVSKKKSLDKDFKLVQYHIYDYPSHLPFIERIELLRKKLENLKSDSSLKLVKTIICNNREELLEVFLKFLEEGYEGAMVRNLDAPYENIRSYNLQKMKEFDDDEFDIVDVKEGKEGTVVFQCRTLDNNLFDVTMSGDRQINQKYLTNNKLWKGKKLTVKFQGYTQKSTVPRFGVGVRIRDVF